MTGRAGWSGGTVGLGQRETSGRAKGRSIPPDCTSDIRSANWRDETNRLPRGI